VGEFPEEEEQQLSGNKEEPLEFEQNGIACCCLRENRMSQVKFVLSR
jgi:hypothetical protein